MDWWVGRCSFCAGQGFRIELVETMADEGLNGFEGEGVAVWLGEKIIAGDMEASEIMRQLRWWSRMVWDNVRG
ncbi:hypothetical protein HZ326_30745 [Fusarium oxysporum f. sp. albedinis]|nr:hypothetical protein HZ326_30745 [Fusarium oxysporum f. sp. albedinis]